MNVKINYTHANLTHSYSKNLVFHAPVLRFPLTLKEKIAFSDLPGESSIWMRFVAGGYLVTVRDSRELEMYYFFDAHTTELLWKIGTYSSLRIIWENEGILHGNLELVDKTWYVQIDSRTGQFVKKSEMVDSYYSYIDESVMCIRRRKYDAEDKWWRSLPGVITIDRQSGKELWRRSEQKFSIVCRNFDRFLICKDYVSKAKGGSSLFALDNQTGEERWRINLLQFAMTRFQDLLPDWIDARFYTSECPEERERILACYLRGEVVKERYPYVSPQFYVDDVVYFTSDFKRMAAVSLKTGELLWREQQSPANGASHILYHKGHLVSLSQRIENLKRVHYLNILDAATGEFLYQSEESIIDSGIAERGIIVNDIFIAYGIGSNVITAFDLNKREVIWKGKVSKVGLGDDMGPVGDGLLVPVDDRSSGGKALLMHLVSGDVQ